MASEPGTTIPRRIFSALEKVFAAEIEDRLPFQSRAKIYDELYQRGMIAPMQKVYGGSFSVTVDGYQLTHAGRYAYCSNCRDAEDVE
jgi:hypothetical protein